MTDIKHDYEAAFADGLVEIMLRDKNPDALYLMLCDVVSELHASGGDPQSAEGQLLLKVMQALDGLDTETFLALRRWLNLTRGTKGKQ